jgi:hypothetical protein
LVRYRTEMTDAGMPMPALVFWMPMPTYVNRVKKNPIPTYLKKKKCWPYLVIFYFKKLISA